MGIRGMQGISAHLEYIGPRGRKARKNCVYNNDGICLCGKIQTYMAKCVGRVYCGSYNDDYELRKSLEDEKKKMMDERKDICKNKERKNAVKKQAKKSVKKKLVRR